MSGIVEPFAKRISVDSYASTKGNSHVSRPKQESIVPFEITSDLCDQARIYPRYRRSSSSKCTREPHPRSTGTSYAEELPYHGAQVSEMSASVTNCNSEHRPQVDECVGIFGQE